MSSSQLAAMLETMNQLEGNSEYSSELVKYTTEINKTAEKKEPSQFELMMADLNNCIGLTIEQIDLETVKREKCEGKIFNDDFSTITLSSGDFVDHNDVEIADDEDEEIIEVDEENSKSGKLEDIFTTGDDIEDAEVEQVLEFFDFSAKQLAEEIDYDEDKEPLEIELPITAEEREYFKNDVVVVDVDDVVNSQAFHVNSQKVVETETILKYLSPKNRKIIRVKEKNIKREPAEKKFTVPVSREMREERRITRARNQINRMIVSNEKLADFSCLNDSAVRMKRKMGGDEFEPEDVYENDYRRNKISKIEVVVVKKEQTPKMKRMMRQLQSYANRFK